ncbi:GAF domain-containing protein [Bacteroidia bacterium]|nr:GAF domain-containing protein [Bacteroidia bacterium]
MVRKNTLFDSYLCTVEQIVLNPKASKAQKYELALKQAQVLCIGESNLIANLANITALLKETFQWFWVGFYIVDANELVLGPFQGPVACTRIQKGKGVCGTAWASKKAIVVPDVTKFPGHIACNAASLSEIVIPILKNDEVFAILDVDSDRLDAFDETDLKYLALLERLVSPLF